MSREKIEKTATYVLLASSLFFVLLAALSIDNPVLEYGYFSVSMGLVSLVIGLLTVIYSRYGISLFFVDALLIVNINIFVILIVLGKLVFMTEPLVLAGLCMAFLGVMMNVYSVSKMMGVIVES